LTTGLQAQNYHFLLLTKSQRISVDEYLRGQKSSTA
jgi:hypothetical protein